MAQTTPKHTQTVSGWAAHDTSGKITPYTFKRRPSEGFENSIGVSGQACCGCRHPCSCNPCYCNGYAIDPSTVSLSASVAPRVMPSEGSEESTEAVREGILPKTRMTVDECRPYQFGAIMDPATSLMT